MNRNGVVSKCRFGIKVCVTRTRDSASLSTILCTLCASPTATATATIPFLGLSSRLDYNSDVEASVMM
ncbi:hypothetical protein VNO80_16764 [Phaseolus coccineus]|uniref:Uncharacterized protein n=1 Tax=Phaseolus coccineus TaxID=3886 RepID=A0AAN9MP77_PHACN